MNYIAIEISNLDKLERYCRDAIDELFDYDLLRELEAEEKEEKEEYQKALKEFVNGL